MTVDGPNQQQLNSDRKRRRERKHAIGIIFVISLGLVSILASLNLATTSTKDNAINTAAALLPTNVNSTSSSSSSSTKITHILHTRFMQDQANLHYLSLSRYYLFESVCYQTISSQTTNDFLWIIRTDPNLDSTVLSKMKELVKPHKNYFLVASNENFIRKSTGVWRGGAEGQNLLQLEQENKIYTGDLRLLHEAIADEEKRILLDTRLDADDGLHVEYMEFLQNRALELFLPTKEDRQQKQKWMFWCVKTDIEWHLSSSLFTTTTTSNAYPGILQENEYSDYCITPGLTVGYASHTKMKEVPITAHNQLMKTIVKSGECGSGEGSKGCIEMVDMRAIRSRSATSAGMKKLTDEENNSQRSNETVQNQLWENATHYFSIDESVLRRTNDYLLQHVVEIAQDNMKGQCTAGHSCKVSSREMLQRFIDVELENSNLVEVHLE